jgi:hypothetical protein
MHAKIFLATLILFGATLSAFPQKNIDSILPVRGFCINAPRPAGVDSFVTFVDKELATRQVNTLFLLIDYRYKFGSHPELTDTDALSMSDAKKILQACQRHKIRIIPQINLLGHQSWASTPNKLMKVYPQFDETPWVKFPEKYEWPNQDKLYCKSYCPLAPGLHEILYAVIDELCDVFETDAFHAGMDEVFYIGEDQCPRCGGRDKAELFAGEVRALHDHLAQRGKELWIWGDRLLDGKTTGLGEWEASYNNTYRAIDMIPKDVVICDWHYERADPTAVIFAMKGFRVVTCPWRDGTIGVVQVKDMIHFRQASTPEMKPRFLGIVETTWSPTDRFLLGYYGISQPSNRPNGRVGDPQRTPWNCFRAVFDEMIRQSGY